MISNDTLIIEGLGTRILYQIAQSVTSLQVSYVVDGASQVTVQLADEKMEMWNNNYFQLNQIVLFRGERYMIASHELSKGEGEFVNIKLELRTEAVQKMKIDRSPEAYKSTTGYEFAQKVATKFGLGFIGQEPSGIKTTTIKVKKDKNKESVYDVLLRSAQDLQYLVFVAEAYNEAKKIVMPTLYFGSPHWLLGRWGLEKTEEFTFKTATGKIEKRPLLYIPLKYPNDEKLNFFLLDLPQMRRSMDSPKESEGRASLWAGNNHENATGSAYNIRAGMTVMIYGIKGFEQAYLITSVEYEYSEPEPIQIAFATIDKISPEDKKKIDSKVSEVTVIG